MPKISVTQCICCRVPFTRLLARVREHGWTLGDMMRETGCGDQCGLCRPYLRRMIATGETTFNELLTE